MKPLALAIALTLFAAAPSAFAHPATPATAANNTPAAKAPPAWVAASNAHAQVLLGATLRFQPEQASFFGIPGYDDQVADLRPDNIARARQATAEARDAVRKALHARGVKDVEMGWILEDNDGMRNIIETIGGVAYKRYRVYQKEL